MRTVPLVVSLIIVSIFAYAQCEEYDSCKSTEDRRQWIQANLGVALPEGENFAYKGNVIISGGGDIRLSTEAFSGTIEVTGDSVIQDVGYASHKIVGGAKVTVVGGRIVDIQGTGGKPAVVDFNGQTFTSHFLTVNHKVYESVSFTSDFPITVTLKDGTPVSFIPPPKGLVTVGTNGDSVAYSSTQQDTNGPFIGISGILGATDRNQLMVWGSGTILSKDELVLKTGGAVDLAKPDMYISPMTKDVCISSIASGCRQPGIKELDYIKAYRTSVNNNGKAWQGYALDLKATGFNQMDIIYQEAELKNGKVANPLVKVTWEKIPAGASIALSEQRFYYDDTGKHFGVVPIGLIDYKGYSPNPYHLPKAVFKGNYRSSIDGESHIMYTNADSAGEYKEGSVSVCSDCTECGSMLSSAKAEAVQIFGRFKGWVQSYWKAGSSEPILIKGNEYSIDVQYPLEGETVTVNVVGRRIDPKSPNLDHSKQYYLSSDGTEIIVYDPALKTAKRLTDNLPLFEGAMTGTQTATLPDGSKAEFSTRPINAVGQASGQKNNIMDLTGSIAGFKQSYGRICADNGLRCEFIPSPFRDTAIVRIVGPDGKKTEHLLGYDSAQKQLYSPDDTLPYADQLPK